MSYAFKLEAVENKPAAVARQAAYEAVRFGEGDHLDAWMADTGRNMDIFGEAFGIYKAMHGRPVMSLERVLAMVYGVE